MRNWLLVVLLVLASCASDGRELAEPELGQTTTTRPSPPTSALESESTESGIALSSPDFDAGGIAPVDVTCAGRNVFPVLEWGDVGNGVAELAVTLTDQTNPNEPLLLWLMAGIGPGESRLDSGIAPAGAFETLNDYGSLGYGTPCLDQLGDGEKELQFRLYLLAQPSGLRPGDPGNEAWDAVAASALDSTSLLMRVGGP
ncbi:MAG: hypothetical protein AAF467_18510 [Actinomycetota bacterium]